MEISQRFASIVSHGRPVGLALTPTRRVAGPLGNLRCSAQHAQGRGISVGFQRREGGGICNASEIIAASRTRRAAALLICKHSGRGRAQTASLAGVWFYGVLLLKEITFTLIKL